jgi:hypothetical protein
MSRRTKAAQASKLEQFVEQSSAKHCEQSGFVQRRSKLSGVIFMKLLILTWLKQPTASLETLARRAVDFGVTISAQGLGKRFHQRAVDYAEGLFEESLSHFREQVQVSVDLLAQFNGIYLLDSTQIALPAKLESVWRGYGGHGSPASLKVHLTFEYLSGQLNRIACVEGRQSDRKYPLGEIPVGSLHLFDLGYFSLVVFAQIQDAKAFFLSRLKSNTVFFVDEGHTRLDLAQWCLGFTGNCAEHVLWIGGDAALQARVLMVRCPPKVAAERRRKTNQIAKQKGWQPSEHHLALLDWNLCVTNIPADWLTFQQTFDLYRIRWQVELIFKLCKSHLGLDQVQGCGQHRILVQLYVRLILLVLLCYLIAGIRLTQVGELSHTKAWQCLQDYADKFLRVFQGRWAALPRLLQQLEDDWLRFAQKSKRKKSPSTMALFMPSEGLG